MFTFNELLVFISGNISPQFAIRSTPPVQQPQPGPPPAQQPRPRRRRRMQFDEATVLTNR